LKKLFFYNKLDQVLDQFVESKTQQDALQHSFQPSKNLKRIASCNPIVIPRGKGLPIDANYVKFLTRNAKISCKK